MVVNKSSYRMCAKRKKYVKILLLKFLNEDHNLHHFFLCKDFLTNCMSRFVCDFISLCTLGYFPVLIHKKPDLNTHSSFSLCYDFQRPLCFTLSPCTNFTVFYCFPSMCLCVCGYEWVCEFKCSQNENDHRL